MRLNPLSPSLPKYPGPYPVGTCELEVALPKAFQRTFGDNLPLDTLLVRLFYPTTEAAAKATPQRHPRWLGQGSFTVRGYATFLGIRERLLSGVALLGLRWTEIPALLHVPLRAATSPSQRIPCMLFSHGLGGSRNAYSQVCGSFASGGLLVAAVEHRDNSAAISVIRQGLSGEIEVPYVSIKETNPTTVAKRRAQVAQRTYELGLGLALVRSLERGDEVFLGEPMQVLREEGGAGGILASMRGQVACDNGQVIAAGHSFGAATAVQCCKEDSSVVSEPGTAETSFKETFQAAVLLDPWMEVLQDSEARPLDVPSIAVASEAFQKWSSNFTALKRLLQPTASNGGRNRLLWVRQSAHLSQSDFQLLFPMATKYAFKAAISPHEAMALNVRAVREFLRELGIGNEPADAEIWQGVLNEGNVLQEEKL